MNLVRWSVLASLCVVWTGCGGSSFKVAKTGGTVMCDGKPVPYVTVYLQPKQVSEKKALVGKQGIGYADSQGNFVVTTYDTNDGAVVGKQNILVGPPLGEVPSDFKCDCVLSESEVVMEVEVVSGKANSFEVQLKKANNFEKKQQEKVIATQRAEQED